MTGWQFVIVFLAGAAAGVLGLVVYAALAGSSVADQLDDADRRAADALADGRRYMTACARIATIPPDPHPAGPVRGPAGGARCSVHGCSALLRMRRLRLPS